jgi:hypothetical protein
MVSVVTLASRVATGRRRAFCAALLVHVFVCVCHMHVLVAAPSWLRCVHSMHVCSCAHACRCACACMAGLGFCEPRSSVTRVPAPFLGPTPTRPT